MSTATADGPSSVDWDLAIRRAGAVAPPGPRAERTDLLALVDELRRAAAAAPEHVARVTGLADAAERAASGPVYVIDRPRWAETNVQMFRHLLEGALPVPNTPGAARFAGEQMGLALAFLSTKVLGQFDPFTPPEVFGRPADRPGRLVLVAPNVLHVERELGAHPGDFRLWVALHEQTHAVQFAAAPWLAEHLVERVRGLAAGLEDPERGPDRVQALLEALPRVLRAPGQQPGSSEESGAPAPGAATGTTTAPGSAGALLDVVLDEDERAVVAEAVAVMSLLEGHADVVMDAVGPGVVHGLRRIRAKFEARRNGKGPLDVLVRRLLGLDAKVAQYRTGAAFVRGVTGAVGHDGLNAVWAGPENLPSAAEILDPAAWVRRVHG